MSQKEQTPFISRNRRRRRKRHNNGSVSKIQFISGRKSAIPLPEQVNDDKKKIVKWGKNNEYPYYLNWLAKMNPMHGGILRAKVKFTVAGGLVYDGADIQAWESFYKNAAENFGEKDLLGVTREFSWNYEKFNWFVAEVRFNAVGPRKFRRMIEIPVEKIRFECVSESGSFKLTGNIKVCDDWSNDKLTSRTLMPYDSTNESQRVFYVLYKENAGQSIESLKSPKINPGIYPDPPYSGAITAIDTGIAVQTHGNSEVHNAFSLGSIISLNNGVPKNDEDKKDIEKEIKGMGTGESNAGGTWITYSNGKDREPSVINLNGNNLPDRYNNTKKGSEDSIIHGHSVVTASMFGVSTPGQLGNTTEMQSGYAIMQANYFTDRRSAILTVLNWVGKTFAGLQGEIKFGESTLQLETKISNNEGSKVSDALNSMSPLVATKVLNSMTQNEVRRLASLPPVEGGDSLPVPVGTPAAFSKEDTDKIIERFKKYGRDKKEFAEKMLHSMSVTKGDEKDSRALLDDFLKNHFATLSNRPMQVLNLISNGEGFDSIRKALDITGTKLAGIYKRLQDLKMISDNGKLLKKGASELASADIERMEILYEYALRPGFKDEIIPGTRDFCRDLIGLNRLYTREEINMISGDEDYDVFAYRGGWYHNPDTDVNEPGCRHEFRQVIVFN